MSRMESKAHPAIYRAELARRTGCHLETVRYYEKTGMLPEPPRSPAGYRLYDANHVARLRFILRARELGFSIEEIRGLLMLVDGGEQTCAEVKARTEDHLAEVRDKIADLQRIEGVLAETLALCSGDVVPDCPILDVLAADRPVHGAEPRRAGRGVKRSRLRGAVPTPAARPSGAPRSGRPARVPDRH